MSATTSSPPSFLANNKHMFTALPTKNGPLTAVTVPTAGVMSLLSSAEHRQSNPHKEGILGGTSKSCGVQEMTDKALQLTRETLQQAHLQPTDTTIVLDKTPKTQSPLRASHSDPPPAMPLPPPPTIATGITTPTTTTTTASSTPGTTTRLNKFVRRLHDMLTSEKSSGIVEWRRGLLVLHSTDAFAKQILPKYFNTRNFKTFRRQLNYYGFVHVRSFSTTGTSTTALWVNRDLAQSGSDDISSVLLLRRVEPCDSAKTTEGRRVRKELAIHTVEEDLGVSAKTLQMEQIRSMARGGGSETIPVEISCSSHKRRCSSLDSTVVTEASSSSSDEESAANLLLNLSKFGMLR